MNLNKVYIIIVTYNGMSWIHKCLNSCLQNNIIVVDNNSTDETVCFIASNYPSVLVLKQEKNLGFGRSNNVGIRYALNNGAEHVLLLNQDAYLFGDVLKRFVVFQQNNPKFGILSSIHVNENREKLDKSFSNFMLKEKSGQFYSDFVLGNTIPDVYEVPFVNAAAWLLSRQCLEKVGGFDPIFFHYGEDNNYCQRVAYHGFKIGVIPDVYIIHDRADRSHNKIEIFSAAYFINIEKQFKIYYADINRANNINVKIKKIKRNFLKLLLQFKFRQAFMYKKELSLIKRLKPDIEKSRAINCKSGQHYL